MLVSLIPAQVFADEYADDEIAADEVIIYADDEAEEVIEAADEDYIPAEEPTQTEEQPAAADAADDAADEPEEAPVIADDEADEIPAIAEDEDKEEEIPAEPETEEEEDEDDEVNRIEGGKFVNPIYKNIITEAELLDPIDTPAELLNAFEASYVSWDTASTQIASAMVARKASVTIYIKSAATDNNTYNVNFWNMWFNACKHTGNPVYGDYIQYQYAGYAFRQADAYTSGGYQYDTYTFTFTYYTTAAQESAVTSQVNNIISSLGLNSSSLSDYDKICKIYNYLCKTINYDYAHVKNIDYKLQYTAYAALCQQVAVCQGISVAFYRLCLASGVTGVRVVTSDAMDHAWNIVNPGNGYYYYVDATWDLWENGYSAGNYDYFLKGKTYYSKYHSSSGVSYLGDVTPYYSYYSGEKLYYDSQYAPSVYLIDSADYTPAPAVDIKFSAPVLTSAANYANYIKVVWQAVSGAELYRLSYREGTGDWVKICDTTTTAVNVTSVKDGATYTFKVECYTKDGRTRTSPDGRIGQMRLTTPAIKVNRFGTPGVDGGFKVSWDATVGGSCYKIYYREKGGSWVLYTMIPKSSNTLFCNIKQSVTNSSSKMTNLVKGRTYEFMVLTATSQASVTSGFPSPFTALSYN